MNLLDQEYAVCSIIDDIRTSAIFKSFCMHNYKSLHSSNAFKPVL